MRHRLAAGLVLPGLVLVAGCARAPVLRAPMQETVAVDVDRPVSSGTSDAGSGGPGMVTPGAATLVAGGAFTCARGDGRVSCCGNGWHGELGNGAREDEGSPVEVEGIDDAVDLVAGTFHACVRRRDGSAWCWGENRWGQLGRGDVYPESPNAAEVPGLGAVVQLSLGILHGCALRPDGQVACWGRNHVGQLGNGQPSEQEPATAVVGLEPAAEVAVGDFFSCARLPDGMVRCWGNNAHGELGDGTRQDRSTPVAVAGLSGVTALALGGAHGCARLEDRTAWCWGGADAAPARGPDAHDETAPAVAPDSAGGAPDGGPVVAGGAPAAVPGLGGVVRLLARNELTCALTDDGVLRCWGPGLGALRDGGAGKGAGLWTPKGVPRDVAAFALGSDHLCVLTGQGALWCGGQGAHGQLCDGSSPPRSSTFPPPP